MKKLLKNKTSRTNLITYLIVIVAFVVLYMHEQSGAMTSSLKGMLVPVCVYIVMAISLNLVVGISGELSLGHAGFMGVGAFTGIVIAALLKEPVADPTVRLLLSMVVGGVFAGIAGFLIGMPVMRLRGDYLAIVTLAFGEILKNLIGNLYIGLDGNGLQFAFMSADSITLEKGGKMILKGALGATGVTKLATFPVAVGLVLFTLFVVLNLINSKEGRAIKAIRDNRIAAESVGLNVTAFRMKAFVISAFLAGMAGALFGQSMASTAPTKFSYTTSIDVLIYVVLGGMGNILGCLFSTTVLYILPKVMQELEDFRMILYAIVLIVLMICTWSPKVKGFIEVCNAWIKDKIMSLFKKKEGVRTNG